MLSSPIPDPKLQAEAVMLLTMINLEFRTDPMSVQCFDLRTVERVKTFVETIHRMEVASAQR